MIIVTGATGLVGSALKELWYERSDVLWCSSKLCDLTIYTDVYEMFDSVKDTIDCVIHLASIVLGADSSDVKQHTALVDNTFMNTNVFKCCELFKVKYIITCSTVALADEHGGMSKFGPSIDLKRHFGYLHSKRHLQALCESYRKCDYGTVLELCPTNIYGYHDLDTSDRLIPSIYRNIVHHQMDLKSFKSLPKNMTRQLIYNHDLAKIISNFVTVEHNGMLLVGASEVLKMDQIAKKIQQVFTDRANDIVFDNEDAIKSRELSFVDLTEFFEWKYTSFADALDEIHKRCV